MVGQVASLPLTMDETEAKETLKEAIAEYINVKVVYAHKVIAETANTKVSHGSQLQSLVDSPYCGCKLTRVRVQDQRRRRHPDLRCGTSQHGLSSKTMALITSDCGCNALPRHQMALITSGCAPLQATPTWSKRSSRPHRSAATPPPPSSTLERACTGHSSCQRVHSPPCLWSRPPSHHLRQHPLAGRRGQVHLAGGEPSSRVDTLLP